MNASRSLRFGACLFLGLAGCLADDGAPENESAEADGELGTASSAVTTTVMVPGTVPHFYEFDAAALENPAHSYWCAHAALKTVYKYKKNTTLTLSGIHQLLVNKYGTNYSTCGTQALNGRCASEDQLLGVTLQYLSAPNSVMRYPTSVDDFFAKVKGGISSGFPAIVGSYVDYSTAGHYYTIVGYTDTGSTSTSTLYVRNTANVSGGQQYDETKNVQSFYKSWRTYSNGTPSNWYTVDKILFITP